LASFPAFATALADFATPLARLPTLSPLAFAMVPHPAPCWRAVVTWLSAAERGMFDCWLTARASRSAMRTSPQPQPVCARWSVTDEAEKAVHPQVAFSSLAIFAATRCEPAEVVAALFTVVAALSNGS
jgi:hypothetical protein